MRRAEEIRIRIRLLRRGEGGRRRGRTLEQEERRGRHGRGRRRRGRRRLSRRRLRLRLRVLSCRSCSPKCSSRKFPRARAARSAATATATATAARLVPGLLALLQRRASSRRRARPRQSSRRQPLLLRSYSGFSSSCFSRLRRSLSLRLSPQLKFSPPCRPGVRPPRGAASAGGVARWRDMVGRTLRISFRI